MLQDFRSEMITFFEKIKLKIIKKFKPEQVLIIDNSHLHAKHKSFSPDKFHIKLIIESEMLKKMEKLEAHKAVFSTLKEEMQNQIHALEFEIK